MFTFEVSSGTIRACDPCYDLEVTWCTKVFENVLNGRWRAYPAIIHDKMWGRRVSELVIVHEKHAAEHLLARYRHVPGTFCVDSGQFGFFDGAQMNSLSKDQFEYEEDTFYEKVSRQTIQNDVAIIPWGVATSSGYGDGTYDVYECRNADGQIISLKAVYIDPYEEQYTDDDQADDWEELMKEVEEELTK